MHYLVRVYDDGDTVIRRVKKVEVQTITLSFDTPEDLKEELIDYGHDEHNIDVAIDSMLKTDDWVEV